MFSKAFCELLGTYFLTLVIGCNVIPSTVNLALPAPLFHVLSIAMTLGVFVWALGPISGGHFNPAVSLSVAIYDKTFQFQDMAVYWLVQIIGALLASLTYLGIFGATISVAPPAGFHWWQGCCIEFIYTLMLALTVLQVACSTASQGRQYFGLAIGLVIVAGGYGAGWISGGGFNPAVTLGINLVNKHPSFGHTMLYAMVQLMGGAAAAGTAFALITKDDRDLLPKLTAEFVGTFFLVFTVCVSVLGTSGPMAALAIAAALTSMIYATGHVSGGHLNPAVTVAILLSGRPRTNMQLGTGMQYIVAQLLGGLLGGLLSLGITHRAFPVTHSQAWHQAVVLEALYTAVLCFAVLTVATTKKALKEYFALVIGLCVVIGGVAAGPFSGGHLNPAVSFGIDTMNAVAGGKWSLCLLWAVGQVLGSAIAAASFRVTYEEKEFMEKGLEGMQQNARAVRAS